MLQHALKSGLILVVLGIVVQDSNACGRCGGGWGCGYGGYGGYGYGGYGRYGGYGYGGYGYGGWGYYGQGPGGYLASSSGGYSSNVARSAARPLVNSSQPSSDSAKLTVSVPADAKVIVNGRPTTSTGQRRRYTCTGLNPAAVYDYQVRAEFVRDGKPVSEEKTVSLTAGQTASLAFRAAPEVRAAEMVTTAQREF
jgi:uncharacterized protein (TIGR03000 family)